MGFFSNNKPLSEEFQEALDPCYTEQNVGRKNYRTGISKLEAAQGDISASLAQGERLINIAPSVTDGLGYKGHLILTNRRVIEFKGRAQKSIPIAEVVDVELRPHPGGYVITTVISETARAYEGFAGQPGTDAGMKYYANTIDLYLNDPQLARHAASLIMGEAGRS